MIVLGSHLSLPLLVQICLPLLFLLFLLFCHPLLINLFLDHLQLLVPKILLQRFLLFQLHLALSLSCCFLLSLLSLLSLLLLLLRHDYVGHVFVIDLLVPLELFLFVTEIPLFIDVERVVVGIAVLQPCLIVYLFDWLWRRKWTSKGRVGERSILVTVLLRFYQRWRRGLPVRNYLVTEML